MKTNKVLINRWFVAIAAVIMQLCLGTVYGWSIFVKPFEKAFGWHKPEVTLVFTIAIGCLGLAAAFGGILVDKIGPRLVATVGAIMFGTGTIITGFSVNAQSLPLVYITYGVLAGLGIGLGYITPISVLVKWFPDKRGMITGMAVMGFGFGAFFMTTYTPQIITNIGITNTLFILGTIFLILTVIAAQFLVNPPAGYKPTGWEPKTQAVATDGKKPLDALKMKEFWLFWFILFINISAGIALISLASPFVQEIYKQTPVQAGVIIGIFGIFNGIGRLIWSWVSDAIGRRNVFLIFFASQAILFFAMPSISSLTLFIIVACFIYSCYGGGFATMPAFAADKFGSKYIGTIYGWILTAWSAAAIFGPMLYASIVENNKVIIDAAKITYDSSKGYNIAFYISAGMFLVALIFPLLIKKPKSTAE